MRVLRVLELRDTGVGDGGTGALKKLLNLFPDWSGGALAVGCTVSLRRYQREIAGIPGFLRGNTGRCRKGAITTAGDSTIQPPQKDNNNAIR